MRRRPPHALTRRTTRDLGLVLIAVLAVAVAATGIGSASVAATDNPSRSTAAIVAKDYDLGIRMFRQPGLTGRLAKMPIRLWGTIAAPAGPGPHPVVVVAHGAHGDGCPGEYGTWPCWKVEQRNDLGFRYLVRALAAAGFVAFSPDLNSAHSGGWGEATDKEALRFGQVVDSTLAELGRASRGAPTKFGIPLNGKADLTRLGLLGHSRGGLNVLQWARGRKTVESVLLVAPFHDPATRIGDVPAAILLGTCDGDTGLSGGKYFTALKSQTRTTPAFQLTLRRANHNYYNQTLAGLRADDAPQRAGCRPSERPPAKAQQAFLARVAVDHFAAAQLGAAPAAWMTGSPGNVYGQTVGVRRLVP